MDLRIVNFLLLIHISVQLAIADDISDLKYPKNEFNSNDTNISIFDLKKESKKDLKKETMMKEIQNETLKLLLKDGQKENIKNKEVPHQRDNSKATSQKEDKLEKMKNSNNINKEHASQSSTNKDSTKDQLPNTEDSHLDFADLLIGTLTNAKMADFRNSNSSFSKQSTNSSTNTSSTGSSTLDDLRIKVIEQVHLKAKIFFQVFSQALNGNQLLRESAIKNKNDALSNKLNSIYSSTPYIRPYQANAGRPPVNSNGFCSSLSTSFQQYSQLNAFLLAAFLLFPFTIPFYLLGWLVLFLTRSLFCIGAKQIVTNVIYRIKS